MNILLLEDSQIRDDRIAYPSERQLRHILTVLKPKDGDSIRLACVDGQMGRGRICMSQGEVFFDELEFDMPPPPILPVTLIVAMPRPQMLKRILQTIGTMGVSEICFIQTSKVEKGFWQSPSATDLSIRENLVLGLEQGMATQLPQVEKHPHFRHFIEERLDAICKNSINFIADPQGQSSTQEHDITQKMTLAIGPEGGFLAREVNAFVDKGFTPIHIGSRILKVEIAIPVLLAKLFRFEKATPPP